MYGEVTLSLFSSAMGPFLIKWFLVLCLVVLFAVYALYKLWIDRLARIPTIHWSASFSRSYILWQTYQNRRRYAHYDAHMKHGEILPVIRVAPNEVSIMTVQGIRKVYDGGFDRTSHYTVFQNFG